MAKKKQAKHAVVRQPVGRPTSYKPEYAEQAYKFCLLGCTDERMAELFGVHVSTIYEWKNTHTEFSESIKNGKEIADANVAKSLYHRATGYVAPDQHVAVIDGSVVVTPLEKHYPPDTAAAFIWLKNRKPQLWRDKFEIDQKSEVTLMDDKRLDAVYERIIEASKEKSRKVANRKSEDIKLNE